MFPALLVIVICAVWAWLARRAAPARDAAISPDVGIWMIGLIWAALGVLVAMALAGGVSLRNHWGVQALQFFPLWLAYRWERRAPIDLRRLLWAALVVHGASLAYYVLDHHDPRAVLGSRRNDTMYPAQAMAGAAVAHWAAATHCPLRYVAGTAFDAGLVALYSGGRAKVFDSAQATPWVSLDDLRRAGALYVLDEHDAVPAELTQVVPFELVPGDLQGRTPKIVRLGVLMPQQPCD